MKKLFLILWSIFTIASVDAQIPLSGFSLSGIDRINKAESQFGFESEEYTKQLLEFSETCRDTTLSYNYPILVNKLVHNLPYIETHYGIESEEFYSCFTSLSMYFTHGLMIVAFDPDSTSTRVKEADLYIHEAFPAISGYDDKLLENNNHYYDYVQMLSSVYKFAGIYDRASAFLKKRMTIEEKRYGKNSPSYLQSVADLAEISEALQDRETFDWIILYLKNTIIPDFQYKSLCYSTILRALPNDLQLSDIKGLLELYVLSGGDLSSLYSFYMKQAYGKRTDILQFIENNILSKLRYTVKDIHNFFYSSALMTACYPDELADFTSDYISKAVDIANSQGERFLNYNCYGGNCMHIWKVAARCYYLDFEKNLFYVEKALEETKVDFGKDSEEYKQLLEEISVLKSIIEMRKSQ